MNKSLLVAVLVLAVALPAAAAEPLITDPCGDLLVKGHVQGVPVATPGEQTGSFDIASADLQSVADGVDASVALCGQAVTPAHTQSYDIRWGVGEKCTASLRLSRAVNAHLGTEDNGVDTDPHATFEHRCSEPPPDGELIGTATTLFSIELPDTAWTIEGNRVTFALRTAQLPADAAALLEPGTTWSAPYAAARYLPASGVGSVFFTDAQGAADVRASDGADWAGTEQSFVVGS